MYETAKETLMYRTVLWTLCERERVGIFGRMALKHVISCMKREKKKHKLYFTLSILSEPQSRESIFFKTIKNE